MRAIILTILNANQHPSTVIGWEREATIILEVAERYRLEPEQVLMLAILRRCENGQPGNEWGVASDDPGHESHRYKSNPELSVRVQCAWAAGTIRIRFEKPYDAEKFFKRWNPAGWHEEVKNYRQILEGIQHERHRESSSAQ